MEETRGGESDPEVCIAGHDFDGGVILIEIFFLRSALFSENHHLCFSKVDKQPSFLDELDCGDEFHLESLG